MWVIKRDLDDLWVAGRGLVYYGLFYNQGMCGFTAVDLPTQFETPEEAADELNSYMLECADDTTIWERYSARLGNILMEVVPYVGN